MRKFTGYLTTVLCATVLSFQVHAATTEKAATTSAVKMTWLNPEKFSDIRPANGSRKAYQERVMKAFDKILGDLAEKLPPGYSMEISVKDIDLAGDVNPMYRIDNTDIRVIKDIYFPRIKLDYVLFDQNKQPIRQESDVKIKDMGFMTSNHIGYQSREFAYEHEMLKKWFNKVIVPQTVSK
ncbi:hypothetical protein A5320_01710 [Rheinheimera sp. SA_1]|jgi:hypothetical protein|uniref:DUF3016 domain-containing protein n=1 Tax=Rheinheimera sp. SA_1 TaxID=1827365 RepID=UPI0007FDF247|nr:DUF3016 domain-containing protein [Rheinheimera sp. SA_1]OBP16161.1 hypothetical protein A5320_01710 [Rheinheimera sp. SA_1]